ncbi:MAG TPA: GNAT family N-acetyltransferase [Thermoplasmata archaeon]|nr:GNAT family N-acetyltransferase [Thermoplasmata archaeon]
MDAPRPTRGAPRPELEALLQSVRRELTRREDAPSGTWVEETAQELAVGSRPGWFLRPEPAGGLAFGSRRGRELYGHVHVDAGPASVERAVALANALLEEVVPTTESANLGFTGLSLPDERTVVDRLAARPGSTTIARRSMERELTARDGGPAPALPSGLRLVPVREVTLEALSDLDRRSFAGSIDALLVGSAADGNREALRAMLDGRLGRFVDEASVALVGGEPLRLVAAVLTTEQSIRRAILVDLMVDPADRRRGVGRFVMTWVLRALRGLGYDSVRLWVTESNVPALGLYDAFGFRTIGGATIYRWDRPASAPQPH